MKKTKKKKDKHYVKWKQVTATALAIAVTATSVSVEAFATEPSQSAKEQAKTESSLEAEDLIERPIELKDVTQEDAVTKENTETSTTFQVGEGKKVSVFYQEPVRFRDESGKLIDYNPALVKVSGAKSENKENLKDYAYENKEGDSKQYFPEKLTEETPLLMEKDGYSTMSTETRSKRPIKRQETT